MSHTPDGAASETPAGLPLPGSTAEALALVEAGLSFLASADAKTMTSAELAGALQALGRAESMHLAATSRVLTAFEIDGGYELEGRRTVGQWLVGRTRVTRAAAGWATAWARRLVSHPQVAAALAAGAISSSWARQICEWTALLPAEDRDDADAILLGAATSGADLDDLSVLAEELAARLAGPDDDGDDDFARRWVRVDRHFRGAGKLDGNLTPSAAQALHAALDKLGTKAGPEDNRTQAQRDHDALEELCQLFLRGGLAGHPGQPAQIQLHITLQQLLGMPGGEAGATAWTGHGVAAPPGADCDATIVPVVTGLIDQDVLAELAAARLASVPVTDLRSGRTGAMAERAAAQLAIKDALRLLSGPGGLAGYLRAGLLTGPAASISLPLDIGRPTETVPRHLRTAITARDRHCAFPGCDRRAARCHVHHLIPRSEGGPTSLENCCLLCTFHHLIAIHRWGWKLLLNPDGTTTARSPDGKRVFHSHAPPVQAA